MNFGCIIPDPIKPWPRSFDTDIAPGRPAILGHFHRREMRSGSIEASYVARIIK
jgi:hypothetical protein